MISLPPIVQRRELIGILEQHGNSLSNQKGVTGILLCDIQNFLSVNQIHGFEVGDKVLMEIYEELLTIRSINGLYRTGGDEFCLILPLLANQAVAQLAANKVIRLLKRGFGGEKKIHVRPVLGVALEGPENFVATDVLLLAEDALSEAKQSSQGVSILTSSDGVRKKRALEKSLELAIGHDEFRLFYQPKVNISNKESNSSEVLLRWQLADDQFISPNEFIPVAEQTGLIQPITLWVIQNTLRAMSRFPKNMAGFGCSVNVSAACSDIGDIIDKVEKYIKIWNVDPKRLTLEITETAFMQNLQDTMQLFAGLRERLGVRISIDDFGTGYSSLEYFKHIQADEVKIDQSFIKNIKSNPADRKIAGLIVQLAKSFGLEVVAEGVEDRETFELVEAMGCDYAQGYYFSRPQPLDAYMKWEHDILVPPCENVSNL
ncbi:MAG: bifunctional diguanylate cyclase/phosphodiesterase [Pseudomonadales bacterium]